MAINIYAFPGGNLTGLSVNPTLDVFLAGKTGAALIQNANQQVFAGPNGTQIRFNGFGLQYDAAGNGIAGTLTSVQIVTFDAIGNPVTQEITFTSAGENSFAAFYAALNTSALDAVKFLMSDADTIAGSATNDDMAGHNGNDTFFGNGGDDHMVGGLGDDTYNGGAGIDEIDYSDAIGRPAAELPPIPHGVFVNIGGGFAFDYNGPGAGFLETFTSIENATGTQFADFLLGDGGTNVFRGLGGNDTINGAGGFDRAAYDRDAQFGGGAGVTVNLATGTATDGFGQTDTLFSIEDVTGTAFADNITGNGASNELVGLGGNDTLIAGFGGTDRLIGGDGDDTYVVDSFFGPLQIVDEEGGSGIDTVQSSVSWSLADPTRNRGLVENLTLTGAAAIAGFGNALGNNMQGNEANNFMAGAGGADVISGNGGDDDLFGDSGNDTLNGGAGDDSLNGGVGNDTLVGGDGVDELNGGLGNDTYDLGSKPDGEDAIIETGGNDTIISDISRSLQFFSSDDATNIENLTLRGGTNGTGSNGNNVITGNALNNVLSGLGGDDTLNGLDGNDVLLGGAGDDTLNGGNGNDQLNGGTGDDAMNGGAGNDVYTVDSANDDITDSAGTDTVVSRGSLNLNAYVGVENGTLIGVANANIIGTPGNNVLIGNAGNNVLSGLGGNDVMVGGIGDDRLIGGAGNDVLRGNDGNDRLEGGAGIDTLTGGADDDLFVYNTGIAAANRDIYVDFSHADDTIGLASGIFGGILGPTVTASEFRAGAAALDASDHLIYNQGTGNLFFDTNGNAAGGVTILATLLNKPVLDASDFALI